MQFDSRATILRFIQLLPAVPTSGDFPLRDLPGIGKRVDVLCRDLAACFDWGPTDWPLGQLEFRALFSDQVLLTFLTPNERMPIGERGWAIAVKNALQGDPPDFVTVTQDNLESMIRDLNQTSRFRLWVLHEEGRHFKDCRIQVSGTQNSFMLGDYRGFDSRAKELISKHDLPRISLGKTSYLSSHCVASVISNFERMVR